MKKNFGIVRMSEVKRKRLERWRGPGAERLYAAIAKAFPREHRNYHDMVAHRYRDVAVDDAVRAILRGYSSPGAAMWDRVLKRYHRTGWGWE